MRRKTDRIAIVGGGIAGCMAARRLTDLGYERVTVFEAEDRVGGKLCTRMVDGQPYELGAIVMTGAYMNTFGVLERLGLDTVPSFHVRHFDRARASFKEAPPSRDLIRQLLAFRAFVGANSDVLASPGAWALDPELCRPFAEWAQAKGFPLVCDPLTTIVTCLGYGRLSDIPAAYVLKFMHRRTVSAAIVSRLWSRIVPAWLNWRAPPVRMTRRGMQRIPEGLTERLDVRLNAPVTAITHADGHTGGYVISAGAGGEGAPASMDPPERFDAVIFATVPQGMAGLDAILPEEVQKRIAQIRHCHYTTILCRADGIDAGCYTYFDRLDGKTVAPEGDRLACILRPHRHSNACVLYHLSDARVSDEDLHAAIARSFGETGAQLCDIIEIRRWRYFPHFDGAALSRDPFAVFEAAQGVNGCYFTGAYLDFETLENSLTTTLKVIDRHFGPAGA